MIRVRPPHRELNPQQSELKAAIGFSKDLVGQGKYFEEFFGSQNAAFLQVTHGFQVAHQIPSSIWISNPSAPSYEETVWTGGRLFSRLSWCHFDERIHKRLFCQHVWAHVSSASKKNCCLKFFKMLQGCGMKLATVVDRMRLTRSMFSGQGDGGCEAA